MEVFDRAGCAEVLYDPAGLWHRKERASSEPVAGIIREECLCVHACLVCALVEAKEGSGIRKEYAVRTVSRTTSYYLKPFCL